MHHRVCVTISAIVATTAYGSGGYAAQTRVDPFVGHIQESWEAFDNYRSTLDTTGVEFVLSNPTPIFQGRASISHPRIVVYEPHVASANLVTSGPAQTISGQKGIGLASTGPQVLPEYVEIASITFSTPVSAFGGYWGATTDYLFDPEVIEFQFFDAADNLIGADEIPYTRSHLINEAEMIYWGDGQLEWTGWQFFTPVKRIVFGGGFVVADFLQATPIPEPSTLALAIVTTLHFCRQSLIKRNG